MLILITNLIIYLPLNIMEQNKSIRIIQSEDDIKHIVCTLRMTLNLYEEDKEHYVKVLQYNGIDCIIARDKIHKLFNKPRVFIPNVDGILCTYETTKDGKKERKIVNPTRLWLKWDQIPIWIEKGKILQWEYLDSSKQDIPNEGIINFFNENYLIFRQAECIHWKMYEKYVEAHNATAYKIFMDGFGNQKQFGKNADKYPDVNDFVSYVRDVGHVIGIDKPNEPSFMTVLIKTAEVVKYILNNTTEDKIDDYLLYNVNPSISALLETEINKLKRNENKASANNTTAKKQKTVIKKNK